MISWLFGRYFTVSAGAPIGQPQTPDVDVINDHRGGSCTKRSNLRRSPAALYGGPCSQHKPGRASQQRISRIIHETLASGLRPGTVIFLWPRAEANVRSRPLVTSIHRYQRSPATSVRLISTIKRVNAHWRTVRFFHWPPDFPCWPWGCSSATQDSRQNPNNASAIARVSSGVSIISVTACCPPSQGLVQWVLATRPRFLGLFTCWLAGHTFSTSSTADFSSVAATASTTLNHPDQICCSRTTGIRSCSCAVIALAFVVTIANVRVTVPVRLH
jgi:hypothetical protein